MTWARRPILAGLAFLGGMVALIVWLRVSYDIAEAGSSLPSFWRDEPSFSVARRALAAATDGRFVYILGGVNDRNEYVAPVEYSRIGPDGRLSTWQVAGQLPEPRFYLGAAIVNGRLYAIGGGTGPLGDDNFPSASAHSAAIAADGELGPWRNEAYLSTPRRGLQVVTWNNRIYAVGGYNGTFLRSVEKALMDRDGRIVEWQLAAEQAQLERYMHAATVAHGRIYVLTGHVEGRAGMGYASVESAPLDPTGAVGPWRREHSEVGGPRFLAAAASRGNILYLIGGHDGTHRLSSVEAAVAGRDGAPGPWRNIAELQMPRSAAATAATTNALFVLGGGGPDGGLNTVESLVIN